MKRALQALALFFLTTGMACPEAASITEGLGFITLTPPSTLYVPGAVLAVEPREDGSIDTTSLKLVCGPRASLGAAWLPVVSQTISQEAKVSKRNTWRLSSDVLGQVRSSSHVDAVSDIEVTLTDAKILTMSDTDLLQTLPERSPECRRAILARLSSNHSLTMVASALIADMTYNVKFRDEGRVDARARSKQMAAIAVSLGGGYQSVTSKKIVARGLAIGIKTDSFLMVLGVPELQGDDVKMNDERLAEALPSSNTTEPDAPVVMPRGYSPSPIYER